MSALQHRTLSELRQAPRPKPTPQAPFNQGLQRHDARLEQTPESVLARAQEILTERARKATLNNKQRLEKNRAASQTDN